MIIELAYKGTLAWHGWVPSSFSHCFAQARRLSWLRYRALSWCPSHIGELQELMQLPVRMPEPELDQRRRYCSESLGDRREFPYWRPANKCYWEISLLTSSRWWCSSCWSHSAWWPHPLWQCSLGYQSQFLTFAESGSELFDHQPVRRTRISE